MDTLKSTVSIAIFYLIGFLSLKNARRLGSLIARLSYRLNTRMVKVTRENLNICLSELSPTQNEQLTKSSLIETGKTAAEICTLWTSTHSPLDYVQNITGEALLKSLYAEKKGLIVLAPHLGNWEMLGHYLATIGPVTNLYQKPKLKGLDSFIQHSRSKAGCELVPADVRGVATLLKSLKAGAISGILPDQNPNDIKSGAFVPFFGEPALTVVLVHKLIKKTGCKAVFAFAKRVDSGFELIFRAVPEDIYSQDMTLALTALNQGIESLVREAPAQYQWEYKRFKHVCPVRGVAHYQ